MKKEIFKRGVALVLGAVMTISILPPLASIPKVEAAVQKTKTVSGLGIDGIINPYGSFFRIIFSCKTDSIAV